MAGERAGIARLLQLVALVCLLCVDTAVWITPAGAVGKTTVDPNTPEAAAKAPADEGFWTADKRLTKQVTFEAQRKTAR